MNMIKYLHGSIKCIKIQGNCINIKMHKFLNKYISNNYWLAFLLSLPIQISSLSISWYIYHFVAWFKTNINKSSKFIRVKRFLDIYIIR